MDRHGLIT